MSQITEEVRLIFSDVADNHNKYWTGVLFNNGDVQTKWGRIGLGEQSKMFPGLGKTFLEKKKAEKLKKGYTECRTIAAGQSQVSTVANGDLLSLARAQIKTNSPALNTLIERLVKVNIHKITNSTSITFNSASGLFTTPLGIVTLDGISDARTILSECVPLIQTGDYNGKILDKINQYLRIVPQNIGMKRLDVKNFFPDVQAVQKQNDILDSLEASYKALQTPAATVGAAAQPVENVFKVRLEILEDDKERARIEKKYRETRKDMHVCAHLKVKQIYFVEIGANVEAFEHGKKLGEIHELWHGTKQANLLSILKSGLHVSPPSTARIAGKMFGNGVYFASDSTKSLNYSFGYWDGKQESNCFMFLAQVAMGKYYVPRGAYESLPKSGFDSTWAKSGQSGVRNDELVVYSDKQFKLNYLVEFA